MRKGGLLVLLLVIAMGMTGCWQSSQPTTSAPAEKATPTTSAAPAPAETAIGETEAQSTEPAVTPAAPGAPEAAAPAAPETPAVPEVSLATSTPAAPAAEGGTPKLVVAEPEYNFGKVDNTQTVEHDFVLRNGGTAVLKIENVRASCGCTTAAMAKDEIQPNEEVSVHATLNLKGRQGPQTKAITVISNDPENPSFQLRITGESIASISIEPMAVQFGRVEDDNPREATVTISSQKEHVTFKVLSAELDGLDFIQHEIKEVEAGKKYEMLVKTSPNLPVGNHNGRFIIRTDSAERAVIWLPVSLQVIGALQVMPPVINIRFSENPEEMEQQQLSITPGRTAEFKVTEVVMPLDTIQHELIEAGPNAYRLRLSNMPRTDALEGKKIILRTNLADSPEVEIPFNIYKPRARQMPVPPAQALQNIQQPPAGVPDVANAPVQAPAAAPAAPAPAPEAAPAPAPAPAAAPAPEAPAPAPAP